MIARDYNLQEENKGSQMDPKVNKFGNEKEQDIVYPHKSTLFFNNIKHLTSI
jgi:hypothetical protein